MGIHYHEVGISQCVIESADYVALLLGWTIEKESSLHTILMIRIDYALLVHVQTLYPILLPEEAASHYVIASHAQETIVTERS